MPGQQKRYPFLYSLPQCELPLTTPSTAFSYTCAFDYIVYLWTITAFKVCVSSNMLDEAAATAQRFSWYPGLQDENYKMLT